MADEERRRAPPDIHELARELYGAYRDRWNDEGGAALSWDELDTPTGRRARVAWEAAARRAVELLDE